MIPKGGNGSEISNRLHETKTETYEIHQQEKDRLKSERASKYYSSINPSLLSFNNTPRGRTNSVDVISNDGSMSITKKWCNSIVKSPKLTSHNFPDILPIEKLSHFYKDEEKKYNTKDSSFKIKNYKFNSKITNSKPFDHEKTCSKKHARC
jgi:hypothetical protein